MRVCVLQMNSGADKARNLEAAERLIGAAAARDRPDLVCLPETFTVMGGGRGARAEAAEPPFEGEAHRRLSRLARQHRIMIHGGSWFQTASGEKLTNTSVVFDRDGGEIGRYAKIHLFDVETPDGRGYKESDYTEPGDAVVTVDLDGSWRLGLSICYDVRFAELYRRLGEAGANLIAVPAAFTLHTGKDHWEVLLRARAIETQAYVVAAAQTGPYSMGSGDVRECYGNAMIVDPWGSVVARVGEGPGFATANLDPGYLTTVRRRIPTADHRRL